MPPNFPPGFIGSLQGLKGFHESSFVQVHEQGPSLVSVRLNPAKAFPFNKAPFGDSPEKVPWSSQGYYLAERPSFTADPLFHAGAYYVQEASSMFLEEAIRQTCELTKSLRVLDTCAAPGGKSTLIQSLLSADSLLISNEVIKTRVNILSENLTKWGGANVIVTNNDPAHFQKLPEFFDLMVVDAPCSGSGLFRKDPGAMEEWSPGNVALCSQRQQRILADCLPSLKAGGVLLYSTCSYSKEEDESIADWLITEQHMGSLPLQTDASWNIVETLSEQGGYGYRFYPDQLRGEGFFIAAFQKQEAAGMRQKEKTPRMTMAAKNEVEIAGKYLSNPGEFGFIKWQEEIIALPAGMVEMFSLVQSSLYLKKAGINMGSIAGKEMIPSHAWALSVARSRILPELELDHDTALQYLRRQDFNIAGAPKGWALVTYAGQALGLVKILPNRLNNYYPKEWRILNK